MTVEDPIYLAVRFPGAAGDAVLRGAPETLGRGTTPEDVVRARQALGRAWRQIVRR